MGNRSRKIRKEKIFELYAQNLELVKRHPKVNLEGERTSGYICPLCNKIYDKGAFSPEYVDQLTEEHFPPGKLGGSVKILTCKICNNTHGSELESHLKEHLITQDFLKGDSEASRPARFLTDGKFDIGGQILKTSTGFHFRAVRQISNHNHFDKLFRVEKPDLKKIDITITGLYKRRKAEIALLRIAYLWLYSEFGFAIMYNSNMHKIREQIQEPEKKIIENLRSLELDYPEEMEGINIITKPKKLQSYVALFKTETNSTVRKHAVFLPGPTENGLDIYSYLTRNDKDKLKFTKLDTEGVLYNPQRVFDYFEYWTYLCENATNT